MKIARIDTFAVKGVNEVIPWMFCAVRTDEGITGYSEFGNGILARGMAGLVKDLEPLLVGKDPRPVDRLYMDLYRGTRMSFGGSTQHAIAGIELALWDIKAKALGVPVHELFGGPHRDRQRVYWSHLGLYHTQCLENAKVGPLRTWDDLADLARMAIDQGYTALKTNILFPGDPPRNVGGGFWGPHEQILSKELLDHTVKEISVLREAAGPDVDIMLDINVSFKPEGAIRMARAMEPFRLFWLEFDNMEPAALRQVRDASRTPVCSGEQLLTPTEYYPYFEQRAMDVVKVDVPWMGFGPARRVADMAAHYELNIAPHNFNAHLSTFQSINLCAACSNVLISESDPLSAWWRDELFTALPEIEDGYVKVPQVPGWGTELREDVAKKYALDL